MSDEPKNDEEPNERLKFKGWSQNQDKLARIKQDLLTNLQRNLDNEVEEGKAQEKQSPEQSTIQFAGWTAEDKAEFRPQMSESLEKNLLREAESQTKK